VFARSCGRTDFPGGDHQALIGSIERMAALDGVDALFPGHNSPVIGSQRVAENFRQVLSMLGR
jgi:glyoxylase-like metal-dependent hydrolase (beta-lactamase superfamily II)